MLTVDTDTALRGRLVAAGRIVVNLWFDGDIVCSTLIVGANGYLTGSAAAREIIIEGQVSGPIHASSVTLKAGCIVEGDVHHTMITIEPGATMTGRASRFPAIQLPAELLQLEAKSEADRAALEDAELHSFAPDPTPPRMNPVAANPVLVPQALPPSVMAPLPLSMAQPPSKPDGKIVPLRRNP